MRRSRRRQAASESRPRFGASSRPKHSQAENRRAPVAAVMIALAALTFAVFAQTLGSGFVAMDDNVYVTANPNIQALNSAGLTWALTTFHAGNWHPLTWLSHMIDFRLSGPNPLGHHLTSLLLHITNVLILFWVLYRMTGAVWKSGFTAALFAVHPMHVESVAWVSERKDVLSTFFGLLTVWAYWRYTRKPSLASYLIIVVLFALGLMAKPMLVSLPILLLLLDWWPLKREMSRRLVWEKLPLLGLSAGSCVMTLLAQRGAGAVVNFAALPLGARAANAVLSYALYFMKMLWPANLACYYPHNLHTPIWQIAAAAIFVIGATACALVFGRRARYLAVGSLWYLIALVPVIGLMQVGGQAIADRYTYLPFVGLFVLVAWGVPDLARLLWRGKSASIVTAALAVLVVLALAVGAWSQARYWHDSITLFTRAVAVTENNVVAQNNLGYAYYLQGNIPEAVRRYYEALRIDPDYPDAHANLGAALISLRKPAEAIAECEKALAARPNHASAHMNLATALDRLGRTDEAIHHYIEAIRIRPQYGQAYANLAIAYYHKRDYAGAWESARMAQRYGGRFPPGFIEDLSRQMPEAAR